MQKIWKINDFILNKKDRIIVNVLNFEFIKISICTKNFPANNLVNKANFDGIPSGNHHSTYLTNSFRSFWWRLLKALRNKSPKFNEK